MGDAAPSEVAGRRPGADPPAHVKPRLRGVSHEVAAFVFPALGLLLVLLAPASSRGPVAIYTTGMTAMYATSACYHRGTWSPSAKQRMRRLDHSMILIGIAATYTPIAAIGLDRSTARPLLAAVWGLAVGGIAIRNRWLGAPRWVVPAVYIAVGWAALAVIPALWNQLGGVTFALLLLGGVSYSLGALVYGQRRPDPVPAVFGYHGGFPRPGAPGRAHLLRGCCPRSDHRVTHIRRRRTEVPIGALSASRFRVVRSRRSVRRAQAEIAE